MVIKAPKCNKLWVSKKGRTSEEDRLCVMRSCGSWVSNRICGWANGSLRASSSLAICGWCGCAVLRITTAVVSSLSAINTPGGYMPTLCSKASPAF